MDYHIDSGVTNSTLWMCKPSSPCNDTHGAVWGKSKGGKPKGGAGDIGGGGGRVVLAIRVVVAPRATKGEKLRRTGADVGRSAQRSPLRKKKTWGTPLTVRWLSFLGES